MIPQYEVEEQSNDVTFKDPYSGKNTLWAPDPDPNFPNPRLRPNTDPLSRPSNYQSLPSDVSAQIAQVCLFFVFQFLKIPIKLFLLIN